MKFEPKVVKDFDVTNKDANKGAVLQYLSETRLRAVAMTDAVGTIEILPDPLALARRGAEWTRPRPGEPVLNERRRWTAVVGFGVPRSASR